MRSIEKSLLFIRTVTIIVVSVLCILSTLTAQPFFPVCVNKKWGAIDLSGKLVLNPTYDDLDVYGKKNNFISAVLGDSTFLINAKLQIVARSTYADIRGLGEGMFETELRSKRIYPKFYGLMDSTGKVIIEPKFSLIESFNNGVAYASMYTDTIGSFNEWKQRRCEIDTKGKWIFHHAMYEGHFVNDPGDSLTWFYEEGRGWGAMDVTKKVIVKPMYKWFGPYKYGYRQYQTEENTRGIMKKDGTITFSVTSENVISYHPESPSDTLVVVHKLKFVQNGVLPYEYLDGKIYTIHGKFLYKVKNGKECSCQCNSFFEVRGKNGKFALMNSSGVFVTKAIYEVIQWCQPGLKQVEKHGKWGFIDNNGKEVIPCTYDDSGPFNNGLAKIYFGGRSGDYGNKRPNVKMGYINEKGVIIWQPS